MNGDIGFWDRVVTWVANHLPRRLVAEAVCRVWNECSAQKPIDDVTIGDALEYWDKIGGVR